MIGTQIFELLISRDLSNRKTCTTDKTLNSVDILGEIVLEFDYTYSVIRGK